MDRMTMDVLRNLDLRLERVEQILPTLSTKDELAAAIAQLATKAELAAAIAPLATRQELREESNETRRHMRVLFESLQSDIRVVAEGVANISQKLGTHRHPDLIRRLDGIDLRVTALESGRKKRRES